MPPSNTVRTVVLAQTLRDFHAWCRETGTSPRDRTVLYVSGPHVLRSVNLEAACIVRYGAWRDRLDRSSLEEALERLDVLQAA